MNQLQALEEAIEKAGGLRALSRLLDWPAPNITDTRKGKRALPPYRAAQLAGVIGIDPKTAYLEALKAGASSEGEKSLLGELLRALKGSAIIWTVALALYAATFTTPQIAYAADGIRNGPNIHYEKQRGWSRL